MAAGWLQVPRAWLESIGEIARFCGVVMGLVFSGRVFRYFGEVLNQAGILILGSTTVIWGLVFVLGLQCGIEGAYFNRSVGAPAYAGVFAAWCDLREVIPYAFGYMMSAKVGTGIVAELGAMRISDEIDALDAMGIKSVPFLVGTRVLAIRGETFRRFVEERSHVSGKIIGVLATFVFISLSFVLIRTGNDPGGLNTAVAIYKRVFAFSDWALFFKQLGAGTAITQLAPNLHLTMMLVILGGLVVQWFPAKIYASARDFFIRAPAIVQGILLFAVAIALRQGASTEAVPFVYFQF